MWLLILLFVATASNTGWARGVSGHRIAALWNYDYLVKCVTGFSGYYYDDYGCYCNTDLRGSGVWIDEIDHCCKIHNQCYQDAIDTKCFQDYAIYIIPYMWTCKANKAKCTDRKACPLALCQCDADIAACFKKTEKIPPAAHHLPNPKCVPYDNITAI